MSTKKELEAQLAKLQKAAALEKSLPKINISDVSIDMDGSDSINKVIAEAVKEGMIALQKIGSPYGIYINGGSK